MTTDLFELRARLEDDFSAILRPELGLHGGSTCYIVLTRETRLVAEATDFYGATSPRMTGWFQREIGSRWQGPGPCVLLNETVLLEEFGGCLSDATGAIAAICCHEFAHRLTDGGGLFEMPESDDRGLFEAMVFTSRSNDGDRLPDPVMAFNPHTARFVRACMHLAHRMRIRGWKVPTSRLFGWWNRCGRPHVFERLLAGELGELEAVPIEQVLTLPIPEAVAAEWEHANRELIG